jgi:hypothetical protein
VCAASTEEHRAGLKCRTNKVGAYDTDTLQGLDKAPVTVVELYLGTEMWLKVFSSDTCCKW